MSDYTDIADIYGYMKQLVLDGVETQGSFSWHVANSDQHLNPLGERYVAEAMLAAILGQDGWLEALGGSE